MGALSLPHLILLFLIILLVFGAKKLPEIGRGLGEGIRSFKSSLTEVRHDHLTAEAKEKVQA